MSCLLQLEVKAQKGPASVAEALGRSAAGAGCKPAPALPHARTPRATPLPCGAHHLSRLLPYILTSSS